MLFDFETLPAADRYKLLTSTVVPRPIAWVVSLDASGAANAAPFSFFNVFSNAPPILAVGIAPKAPGARKDTARNIAETGEFVVNLVPAAAAERMNITAIEFETETNELSEAGLTPLPSTKVAPPRIAESPVAMECRRHSLLDLGGGRVLVLGEVVAMHIADVAVLDPARCHVDTPKLDLIGRMHGRGWYARTRDVFDMPRIARGDWTRGGAGV